AINALNHFHLLKVKNIDADSLTMLLFGYECVYQNRLFALMEERHVTTWNAMIDVYGMEAIKLFSKIEKRYLNPNNVTFLGIIYGCSHSGFMYYVLLANIYMLPPQCGKSRVKWKKKGYEIYDFLETLIDNIKAVGYVPDNDLIHEAEDDLQEKVANCARTHSEKLAIAFVFLNTSPSTTIQIRKNLHVCGDCHNVTKYISLMEKREIIVSDLHQFHYFKNRIFSCGDNCSGMIDLKELPLVSDKSSWMAYVDICCLDADGALFDDALFVVAVAFSYCIMELAHGHAPFSKYPPMKVDQSCSFLIRCFVLSIRLKELGLDYERDKKFSKSHSEEQDKRAKILGHDGTHYSDLGTSFCFYFSETSRDVVSQ
nr:pentatricopeptide repeat-containing protein At1g11290, chloroplastic [Tanacetum cinerariifolium]